MNTIIEKIRAEIKTRLSANGAFDEEGDSAWHYDQGLNDAYNYILSFLSDLEKSENPINPTIEKLRALIKMQIRREELNFASLGGGGQTMNIGALEWVLKQLDTLQEQTGKDNALFDSCLAKVNPETREEVRKNIDKMMEQPVSDGFDGEFSKFSNDVDAEHPFPICVDEFKDFARHFYELGRQSKPEVRFPHEKDIVDKVFGAGNLDGWEYDEAKALVALAKEELLKDIKPEVSEGFEEEVNRWMGSTNCFPEGVGITPLPKAMEIVEKTARHFAKWQKEHDAELIEIAYNDGITIGMTKQKEQLMKEAVEGRITQDSNTKLIVVSEPIEGFKFGDKGHIIFVKEEGK